MIPTDKQQQIKTIWDQYIQSNQLVIDTKGKEYIHYNFFLSKKIINTKLKIQNK